jgi:hypothetical protein
VREEWRAQGDDFRTFLGDFVAALPRFEFPAGLVCSLFVSPEESYRVEDWLVPDARLLRDISATKFPSMRQWQR